MNLPSVPYGIQTLAGIVDWLRTLAVSIAAGWTVEHTSTGQHGAVNAASVLVTGSVQVDTDLNVSGAVANAGNLTTYGRLLIPNQEGFVSPTSPDVSYASGGMNYQRVGTWVHVTGFVTFPATADGNQAAINNLPYTSENSSQARGGCVCHYSSSGAVIGGLVLNGSTSLQFITPSTGAAVTNATLSGALLFFSFTYRANA